MNDPRQRFDLTQMQALIEKSRPWFDLATYFLTAVALGAISAVGARPIWSMKLGSINGLTLLLYGGYVIIGLFAFFLLMRVIDIVALVRRQFEDGAYHKKPWWWRVVVALVVSYSYISITVAITMVFINPPVVSGP